MALTEQPINDPFDHDPRVAGIDARLEELDALRVQLKEEGAKLMAEKAGLMMREQLTLRILNGSPLSGPEMAWADANPEVWKEIQKATRGRRGSRRVLTTAAK